MPPKKSTTKKALAAELKKKNALEAENIISMLNQNRFCFIPSSNTTGAVSTLMSNDSMASGSSNRADPKSMTQEALAAEVKKKNASGTKKKIPVLTSKKTRIVPSPKSSKTSGSSNSAETVDLTLAETSPSAGVDKDMINPPDMANDAETVAVIDSAVEILNENFVASTDTGAGTGASSNFPLHVVSNATYKFHYEIDCVKVGNSINVVDLQFIENQLKFNGEKGNLEDNVKVFHQGQKVVIKSRAFLPKRSLRFLCKKFLKKAWNIQVISKNKNSYEFKFVGSL